MAKLAEELGVKIYCGEEYAVSRILVDSASDINGYPPTPPI